MRGGGKARLFHSEAKKAFLQSPCAPAATEGGRRPCPLGDSLTGIDSKDKGVSFPPETYRVNTPDGTADG